MKNFIDSKTKIYIENNFNVKILFLHEYQDWNGYSDDDVYNRAFQCGEEIYLGKYDNPIIEAICLFHELGHIASDNNKSKTKNYYISKFTKEVLAWEIGMELLMKYKHLFNLNFDIYNYNGIESNFIRNCLKSYTKEEYL